MEDNTAEELMQAFRVFDTEGTGKINAEDLRRCRRDHDQCASLLLRDGAKDNKTNPINSSPMYEAVDHQAPGCVGALINHTDRAARLYNRCMTILNPNDSDFGEQWAPIEAADAFEDEHSIRYILERQIAVRAEDSDDDDDPDRTYAFPPPVDLNAYAAACRLPPAEETEDEREARFQVERAFGL